MNSSGKTERTLLHQSTTALLIAYWAFLYLRKLGTAPLKVWDEGIYASAAKSALEHGNWIIPHVLGGPISMQMDPLNLVAPFLEKPPLYIWLEAGSMTLFEKTAFAARLPSAIAVLGTSLLVYYIGDKLFTRTTGSIAGIFILSVPLLSINSNGGRMAATDTLTLFLGSLTVFSVYMGWEENKKWLYIAAAASSATFMAKGLFLGLFLIICLPALAWKTKHSWKTLFKSAIVATAIPLAWLGYAFATHGWTVFNELIWQQTVMRALHQFGFAIEGGVFWFMRYPYLRNLPQMLGIWTGLSALALITASWLIIKDSKKKTELIGLIWWLSIVIVLILPTGNGERYLMPILVPTSLLVGYLFTLIRKRWKIALLAVTATLSTTILSNGPPLHQTIALTAVILAVPAIKNYRYSPILLPLLIIGALLFGSPISASFPSPCGPSTADYWQEEMGETINSHIPSNKTVYVTYDFYYKNDDCNMNPLPTLAFFSQNPLRLAENISQSQYLLAVHQPEETTVIATHNNQTLYKTK